MQDGRHRSRHPVQYRYRCSVHGTVRDWVRKLLHIAFGVLKSGRPFDPDFVMTQCIHDWVPVAQVAP